MKKFLVLIFIIFVLNSYLSSLKSNFVFSIGTGYLETKTEKYNPGVNSGIGLDLILYKSFSTGLSFKACYFDTYDSSVVDTFRVFDYCWKFYLPLTFKYFISYNEDTHFYPRLDIGYGSSAFIGRNIETGRETKSFDVYDFCGLGIGLINKIYTFELIYSFPRFKTRTDKKQIDLSFGVLLSL